MLAHDILRLGHDGADLPRPPREPTLPANDPAYRLRLAPAGDPPRPNTNLLARRRDRVPPSTLKLYEEYHPYGSSAYRAVSSGIEVSAKRYRYTGKERDEETGLDHMGARYYAGWLGRWTSADPIGLGDGVNRYAYVRGNPVGMRDPSGTQSTHSELLQRQTELVAQAAQASPGSPDQESLLIEVETIGEEISAEMQALQHDYAVDDEVPESDPSYNEDVNYESAPAPRPPLHPASGAGTPLGRRHNTDPDGNLLPATEDPYAGARELARHPESLVPVVGPAIDSARSFAAISSKNSWDENVALGGLGVANAAFTVIDFVSLGLASAATQGARTAAQLVVRAEARNVGRAEVTRALDPVVGGAGQTVGELRAAGRKDAHHVIQDAAVRDVPGYDTNAAPGVQLPGPSTRRGSPHYEATQVQLQAGGGTYAAERRIGYRALRAAGFAPGQARAAIEIADEFFRALGVGPESPTRIPANRRRPR